MDSRVKLYCIFTWKTQSKKLNSSALSEMIWKFYGFFRRAGMSVPMTRNNYHGYLSFSNRGKPTYTPPQEMLFNNCPILIDHEFDWSSFRKEQFVSYYPLSGPEIWFIPSKIFVYTRVFVFGDLSVAVFGRKFQKRAPVASLFVHIDDDMIKLPQSLFKEFL